MVAKSGKRVPGAPADKSVAVDGLPENSRHREILNVAADCFHHKGFHATSIQDIAERVGMLKGSLYYYISSKDQLLQQIINDVHQDGLASMQDVFESDAPALKRLRMFVSRHVIYSLDRAQWMGVFLHEYKAMKPSTRDHVRLMRDRYEHELDMIIDEGKSTGSFSTSVETRLVTRAILGMCNSVHLWFSPDRQLTADQVAESFADLALGMVGARGGQLSAAKPS